MMINRSYMFVDNSAVDIDAVRASLAADAVVVVLDPIQDGLTQIAQALSGVTNLDAIHIISHGAEGTLYLGSTVLNNGNLSHYSSKLATIGAALSDEGDILLYGCEVASSATGQTFIQQFAALTGADVAASTDYTGSAALGGNWVLEAGTGAIAAQVVATEAFDGLLAPPVLTPAATLDRSFDGDGKLTTAFSANIDRINSVALQRDGKIVAGGYSAPAGDDFALARYNANGILDTTFDGDGKVTLAVGASADRINDVAVQADGKIVVAGYSFIAGNNDFVLARYNANGTLDTTFANGGIRTNTTAGARFDELTSVALQADGKIVAGGFSNNGGNRDFALLRYNPDGSLDTTFAGGGMLIEDLGTVADEIRASLVQADGKIIVGGISLVSGLDFALARYNYDGTPDKTFDLDGKLTTAIATNNTDQLAGIALQADGKIVAAGISFNGFDNDFALARYNADGSLDTTFSSDGKVVTPIFGEDIATSVIVQSDGRIVVGGRTFDGINYNFVLVRYTTSGVLDVTFDGDGILAVRIGSGEEQINSLLQQADGAIVAGGYAKPTGIGTEFALLRVVGGLGVPDVTATENAPFSFTFNANAFTDPEGGAFTYTVSGLPAWLTFTAATRTFSGTPGAAHVGIVSAITITARDAESLTVNEPFNISVQNNDAPVLSPLDAAFADGGVRIDSRGIRDQGINDLAIQADGKIVVAGYAQPALAGFDFALRRYNTDGSPDTTFDLDGERLDSIGVGPGNDEVYAVALQADGKIVVAGRSFNGANTDFALARYNTNGSLDTGFDGDGKRTDFFGTGSDQVFDLIVQADGKIVAAGASSNGSFNDFALARYNANGSLDSTFDGDGKVVTPVGTSADSISGVAQQADGKLVVAGLTVNAGGNNDFALVRYSTNGSLDSTFGTGGIVTSSLAGASNDSVADLIVLADGKILVSGSTTPPGGNAEFALARYNTNGTLDTTFDGDGIVVTPIGTSTDLITSMALQADGRIVVAGWTWNGSDYDFAVARYNANGGLDSTFDGDGKLTIAVGTGDDTANSVKIQSSGAIVIAGTSAGIGGLDEFAVIRLPATPGIADKTVAYGVALNYAAVGLIDPEGGALVYSATLADGAALPAWLNFAGGTNNAFKGTPLQSDVGRYDIKVIATDIWGAFTFDTFGLAVINTTGTSGNDTLYGGLVADTMTGLAGDDVYIVDNISDVIVEAVGGGIDLERSSVNENLAANVENLMLIGSVGISGTGNALNNLLIGNSGNNTLNGVDGNDTLIGGIGNDFLSGGLGIDFADYSSAPGSVAVNLTLSQTSNDGQGGIDGIIDVENLIGSNFSDTLVGDAAINLLRGLGGNDTLDGGTGIDTADYSSAPGGVTAELWRLLAGNDGQGGADTLINIENLVGSASNDTLAGNSVNNSLTGGAGSDTAVYTTAFRQSALSGSPLTGASFSGPDGSDTLISIESLRFLDGIRSYDGGAPVWQIERLYGSAFDRPADVLGRNFHSGRLDAGTTFAAVAQDFAGSAEFLATYGSLSNSQFVNQLYLNVLNRTADAGGLSYWTGQLDSAAMTRGAVLAGFSDSAENISNYAGQVAGGLWDIDESAASVARLYHGTLDRIPEVGGLSYWTSQLKTGAQTLQQEAAAFVASAEFQDRYGSLDNNQFVNQLYLNVLDRPAEPSGLAYWTGLLNTGASRADVALGFTESFEFQVNILGQIENGIVVL